MCIQYVANSNFVIPVLVSDGRISCARRPSMESTLPRCLCQLEKYLLRNPEHEKYLFLVCRKLQTPDRSGVMVA